jgi:hypothetical protein
MTPIDESMRRFELMTASSLRDYSCKDLAQMAKSEGLPGWHSMRKDELVRALANHARRKQRSRSGRRDASDALPSIADHLEAEASGKARTSHKAQQQLEQLRARLTVNRQLAGINRQDYSKAEHDRLVVMVRDPYWLHVYWELAPRSVERAQSALGQHWHTTKPVLRLFRLSSDGTAELQREIVIHGGVNHWYVDVQTPPQSYRMEIGYLASSGQFFCLARSNAVTTPPAATSDSVDENWVDIDENADRIFAMSGGYTQRGTSLELQELLEERLRRPMGTPMKTRYGGGASRVLAGAQDLPFAVDAELLVYGVSHPDAHVTLQGEPVPLRPDGTFTARMSLPDRRQVIPVIASSPDGVEQRTIILAVERNTKVLEPVLRDPGT